MHALQACFKSWPSPTTPPANPLLGRLLLLYAADLAFRLRWEIRPALAEGYTVVAAPYVETAVAFGEIGRASCRERVYVLV